MSVQAYEKGQRRDYTGDATRPGEEKETFAIEGSFNVIETGDGYAVLEDARADVFCEIKGYDRALTRYRISTKA